MIKWNIKEEVTMAYKILVVEDEHEIQQAIRNFLVREGYEVTVASDGQESLDLFEQEPFQLVLLDMMLPKIPGEQVLAKIREKSEVPIIIISALDDELIQQDAFMQKVDDYVTKPFSIRILMYKIAALLRREYKEENETIQWENIKLMVNNYEVFKDEELIALTTKEFEVLQVLMLNNGRVYSREQLLTLVWGYDYYGDDRIIDVHIKNMRKKLKSSLITTVKGVGYKVDRI